MPLREAQLVIRDASTVANPDGTVDVLVVSTRPSDAAPYMVDWPEADGQSIDPITGQLQVGAYTVLVADALTGGTNRVLTSLLHDASNRPHLLSRRVYLRTATDGGSWETRWAGYLLDLELVDAVTWRLQLGDSRRIEQSRRLWQQSSLDFPIRGALFGGPTIGGWLNGAAVDRGGWEFIVKQVVNGRVYAEFVAGYRAGGPRVTGYRAINVELKDIIDNAGGATLPYDLATQTWPARAVVQGYGTFQMCANDADTFFGYFLRRDVTVVQLGLVWPTSPPALNTVLRISAYATQVQPASPLYFTEHPCDLLAKIWAQEGIPYDATALAAVRASVGDRVRLSAKVTEPPRMTEWLEQAIYGPFGIGVRPDTQGRAVAFRTRLRSAAVPTLQINPADLVQDDPVVFSLSEKSAIVRVSVRTKQYLPWQPLNGGDAPIDGIIEGDLSYEPGANPDASTFATREVTFDVPGMIHTADSTSPDARDLTQAIALEIYDRWGRGCPTASIDVTLDAPAAAAQVGDEVYVALAQAPNANKRLGDEPSVGARIAQVVQRTELLDAVRLQLLDSGTGAQAVAPAAVLAIAVSSGAPRAVASITITNAAAINATGVLGVAIEWATGASAPSGAGADLARFAAGQIPTGAIATPASPAGTRVWARARTEQQGRRPSSWSPWVDVTLTGLVAPTGLTAVLLPDALTARLAWNPASGTNRTEIYLYQGSSAPGDWSPYLLAVLPVGASPVVDAPVLAGGLPYQWRVRQLEADGTPGAAATGSFTGPVSSVVEPTLQCSLTLTATTAEIAFVAIGAVEFSVDGGTWTAAASSPIVVARNAAGGALKAVTVRATLDGRLVTDTLPVPPQGWVGDGSIDVAKFAAGLRPIEILTSLPPDGVTAGRIVLLTTDWKLYRWTGTVWTAYVSAGDIAGQLADAQIAALAASKVTGQLTDAQLAGIAAAKIAGQLSDAQLAAIAAAKITGQLTDAQLAAIAAAKITGQLTDAQLAGIAAAKIAGQITGTQITDGAISTPKLAAGAVTAAAIAAETITAAQIAADAITAAELAAGAVTTPKIAAGAVTAGEIAADAITAAKIAAGAVTTPKIAAGAVTAGEIAADAITAAKIAAGAVTTPKIAAGAVTAAEIAADAVTAAKIAAGAVVAGKIAAGAVTAVEIAANTITAAEIAAGAIGADELAANSVIAGKIAAGVVNTTELAAGAVTASRIAAATITGDRIAAAQSISAPIIEGGRIRGAFVDVNHLLIRDTLEIRPTDSLGNPVTRTRKVAVSLASFVSVDLPGSGYVTAARRLEWSIEFSANALSVAALSMGAPAVLVAPVVVPAGATLTSAGAYFFAQSDRQVRLLVTTQAEGASTWATIGDSGWVTSFGWLSTALSHLVTAGQSLVFLLLIQNTSSSLYGGIIAPTVDYTVPTYTIGV